MNHSKDYEVDALWVSEFIFGTHTLKIVKYNKESTSERPSSQPHNTCAKKRLKKLKKLFLPLQFLTKC